MPEFQMRGNAQIGDFSNSQMNMLVGNYSNRPNTPLFVLDGFETTLQRIVDLDPERVESITILKDASATAIYGSRASNGIFVITSVAPQPGKLHFNYSLTTSVTAPDLTDYHLLNAKEKLAQEIAANQYLGLSGYQKMILKQNNILRGVDTYWLNCVRNGIDNQ